MEENNLRKETERNNQVSLENKASENLGEQRKKHLYVDECKIAAGTIFSILGGISTLCNSYMVYDGITEGNDSGYALALIFGLATGISSLIMTGGIKDVYEEYAGKQLGG